MAKLVKNKKGFKVIKLSQEETKRMGWGIDIFGKCLCMHCNEIIKDDIYYIVVLHDTMDKECYEKWLETAINYPEDRDIEEMEYKGFLKFFKEVVKVDED